MPKEAHEKALVLWGNTSLGLLMHWWHANKPQPGRGNIGKSTLETLPILDVTKLTEKQLASLTFALPDKSKIFAPSFPRFRSASAGPDAPIAVVETYPLELPMRIMR
jgi:hypothetical protein